MRKLLSFACIACAAGFCPFVHRADAQAGGFYGGQPYTGGVLPDVGTNARVGDLRPQLERYFETAGPPATEPHWLVQPALDVDAGVTDNALRIERPREPDFLTHVSPQIVVSGDTARLKANVTYTPVITLYGSHGSQDRFDHFANGQALLTLVPDAAYVDLRGSITRQSLVGNGIDQYSTDTYNRQNSAQNYSFAATPYVQHRFGGWGTATLGYSYARTIQDAQDQATAFNQAALATLGTPAYGTAGNLTTQRERASFTTGENLGRINDFATLEAIQYGGGGSYSGAYRNLIENEVGYALTRRVTLLGGIGYQDLRYSGVPTIRVNEPIWNVGARYTANPDSTLTLLYGRRDGFNAFSFDGQFAPTARTRLIGRYSTGITSDAEQAQDVLDATSVGPAGLLTDTATGAPAGYGNAFGVQNGVFKLKRLSFTGLLFRERDSYSAGVTYENRTTLSNAPALSGDAVIPAGTASNSVYASVTWQHDLAPDLSSVVLAQYAVTNQPGQLLSRGGGDQRTLSLTAALTRQFTPTLSGSVRYTFADQSGGYGYGYGYGYNYPGANQALLGNTGSYVENVVLVGLHKTF